MTRIYSRPKDNESIEEFAEQMATSVCELREQACELHSNPLAQALAANGHIVIGEIKPNMTEEEIYELADRAISVQDAYLASMTSNTTSNLAADAEG